MRIEELLKKNYLELLEQIITILDINNIEELKRFEQESKKFSEKVLKKEFKQLRYCDILEEYFEKQFEQKIRKELNKQLELKFGKGYKLRFRKLEKKLKTAEDSEKSLEEFKTRLQQQMPKEMQSAAYIKSMQQLEVFKQNKQNIETKRNKLKNYKKSLQQLEQQLRQQLRKEEEWKHKDEIITELKRLKQIKVVSESLINVYRGKLRVYKSASSNLLYNVIHRDVFKLDCNINCSLNNLNIARRVVGMFYYHFYGENSEYSNKQDFLNVFNAQEKSELKSKKLEINQKMNDIMSKDLFTLDLDLKQIPVDNSEQQLESDELYPHQQHLNYGDQYTPEISEWDHILNDADMLYASASTTSKEWDFLNKHEESYAIVAEILKHQENSVMTQLYDEQRSHQKPVDSPIQQGYSNPSAPVIFKQPNTVAASRPPSQRGTAANNNHPSEENVRQFKFGINRIAHIRRQVYKGL